MSYFLRKSVRKRGLYLQIYESHYSKERKKTVTRFVMTIGYHEDLKKIHRDPVDHGLLLVRAMNCDVPRKIRGKTRRADIDNARFVDIVRPLELLRAAMDGKEALPQLQERLSLVGDIAAQNDAEGRNMRHVLSRLWESHDPLLRGLMRMSHEAGFLDEFAEAALFPLIPHGESNFLIMTDHRFFPVAILDAGKLSQSKSYVKNIKAELPSVCSYLYYGSPHQYEAIHREARECLPCLLRNQTETDGARRLFSIIEMGNNMVEAAFPPESQTPPDAKAWFVFFAVLLRSYQDKRAINPDASF